MVLYERRILMLIFQGVLTYRYNFHAYPAAGSCQKAFQILKLRESGGQIFTIVILLLL